MEPRRSCIVAAHDLCRGNRHVLRALPCFEADMPTDERIIMIGDVARGEHRSVRGSAEFIHDDAIIDLKSGLLRKA